MLDQVQLTNRFFPKDVKRTSWRWVDFYVASQTAVFFNFRKVVPPSKLGMYDRTFNFLTFLLKLSATDIFCSHHLPFVLEKIGHAERVYSRKSSYFSNSINGTWSKCVVIFDKRSTFFFLFFFFFFFCSRVIFHGNHHVWATTEHINEMHLFVVSCEFW